MDLTGAERTALQFLESYFACESLEEVTALLGTPFLWCDVSNNAYSSIEQVREGIFHKRRYYGRVFRVLEMTLKSWALTEEVANIYSDCAVEVSLPEELLRVTRVNVTMQLRAWTEGWKIHLVHASVPMDRESREAKPPPEHMEEVRLRDPLTEIWSMEGFVREIRRLLAANPGQQYAFLKFGINNFRYINRCCGFDTGDKVLRNIAKNIYNTCRAREVCGRVENDIFSAMLAYDSQTDLDGRMEEIRRSLVDADLLEQIGMEVNFCGGIYLPSDAGREDIKDMLDKALIAMQSVPRRMTGSRYLYYEPDMSVKQLRESHIMEQARGAIEREEFQVYIQPQVETATGRICSGEALVRWTAADGSVFLPGDFIPLFERTKFILDFDFYMLEHYCRHIRTWLDEGLAVVPVSLNQSRYHLEDPNYFRAFCRVLDRYRIPHKLLIFELTESAFVDDTQRMMDFARKLHRHHFRLAIDDFGTGFTSLNMLSLLSADILKIDQSLIADASTPRGKVVLKKVIEMAKETQMKVVCEGVETKRQAQLLKQYDCEMCQGFYFYHPMPAEEFKRLLEKQKAADLFEH